MGRSGGLKRIGRSGEFKELLDAIAQALRIK
jgi:hypothetical protein